jgi:hypothetical protein
VKTIRNAYGLFVRAARAGTMLSLDQCKALLENHHLSDTEVEALRDALYEAAQLASEVYWSCKSGSKSPVGLLPKIEQGDSV